MGEVWPSVELEAEKAGALGTEAVRGEGAGEERRTGDSRSLPSKKPKNKGRGLAKEKEVSLMPPKVRAKTKAGAGGGGDGE